MNKPLKVLKLGKSLGVDLPKKLLDHAGVGEGDVLYPIRTDYGVELSTKDSEFIEAIESDNDFMRKLSE